MPKIEPAPSLFYPPEVPPKRSAPPRADPTSESGTPGPVDAFVPVPSVVRRTDGLPSLLEPVTPVSLGIALPMNVHGDTHQYQMATFSGPLFTAAGPSKKDITQGQAGNCYLLSTMAALANTDPEALRNMIQANGDGSYTVRFFRQDEGVVRPNPIVTSVRVNADFLTRVTFDIVGNAFAFTPVYATSLPSGTFVGDRAMLRENAMWVPVLEKAYTVFRGGKFDLVGQGGWSHEVMASLLGRKGLQKNISTLGQNATWSLLKDSMATHSPITISTFTDAEHAAMFTNSGLVPGHAYAFIDAFERESERFVTLRNPWGHFEPGNDGVDDGEFTLSLPELARSFDILAYAPKTP